MELKSSVVASLTSRGVAASAAAVLMVGGGVAVAQNGALSASDEGTPVEAIERADDTPNDEGTPVEVDDTTDCPDVAADGLDTANEAGNEDLPGDCPPAAEDEEADDVSDEPEIGKVKEGEEASEDSLTDLDEVEALDDGASQGDAEAFSTWVQSLDGSELGCLKGQLVSHFARQGPTNFEGPGPTIENADQALAELQHLHGDDYQSPGRCAERLSDEADAEDSSAQSGTSDSNRPAHAGKSGPPDHAGPKGDGPGNSGEARRAGNGQGNGNGNGQGNGNGNGNG